MATNGLSPTQIGHRTFCGFFLSRYGEEDMQTVYAGRHPSRVVRALTLDREASEWLDEQLRGAKQHGVFISRLLFEERARREERQRLRALLGDDEE